MRRAIFIRLTTWPDQLSCVIQGSHNTNTTNGHCQNTVVEIVEQQPARELPATPKPHMISANRRLIHCRQR